METSYMKKITYALTALVLILSALLFTGQKPRRDMQIIYPEQNKDYRIRSSDLLNTGYDLKFVFYGEKGQTGLVFVR